MIPQGVAWIRVYVLRENDMVKSFITIFLSSMFVSGLAMEHPLRSRRGVWKVLITEVAIVEGSHLDDALALILAV